MNTTIGLVDDHQLFLKSLALMLEDIGDYDVVVEALNGKDLQQKMANMAAAPEIMLVDVNMPVMNGIETCKWLNAQYPAMKLIALSMNDKDKAIIEMLRAGCCAYLLKDTHPTKLEKALDEVNKKGYYNADSSNMDFRRLLLNADATPKLVLSSREQEVLPHICSELTYTQIAAKMKLSERTIDGYRESLFQKFHVQSRVGLCLEAIRRGYVSL